MKDSLSILGMALFVSVTAFFVGFLLYETINLNVFLWGVGGALLGGAIGWLLTTRKHLKEVIRHCKVEMNSIKRQIDSAKQELTALYNNSNAQMWSIDIEAERLHVSKGILALFQYTQEEVDADYQIFYTRAVESDKHLVKKHYEKLLSGEAAKTEWCMYKKDGTIVHLSSAGEPIFGENGQVIRIVGVVVDLSKEVELAEAVNRIAMTDTLTQLPNQVHFNKRLEEMVEMGMEENPLAIFYFNVDRLKFINDMMGFEVGDELLILIAERLPMYFGHETLMARYGGDEFIVAYPYQDQEAMQLKVDQFMQSFRSPFLVDDEELFLTISAGAALYPKDAKTMNSLLSKANASLKRAKLKGKNNIQYYIRENEELQKRRLRLEHDLKRALEYQEFELYYQPKVSLVTRKVQGVEALIRWQHPILGEVSPGEFIPIAEDSGQIVSIGNWVLTEAVQQIHRWQVANTPMRIAINVSSAQLESPVFMENLERLMEEYKISSNLLGVELTEGMVQNLDSAIPVLFKLRQLGVTIYIDDFGTGYSSLAILNQLPIDFIKIDKSFVREVPHNAGQATLVKTIIEMGRNLGFQLVAEGVEREEQAEFLLQNGCTKAQGFYFSHPLPIHEFEKRYLA